MAAIISGINADESAVTCWYGTNSFEHIWEKLIDHTYGESDKSNYFPHTYWHINGRKSKNYALMPDTIMCHNNLYFVLDAKYYQYGISGNSNALPDTSSIAKQVIYGEYLETGCKKDSESVYNAFLLPFNSTVNKKAGCQVPVTYIGYADADWKTNVPGTKKSYLKIKAFLIDIRTVMYTHPHKNAAMITELSNIIERS